MTGTSPADDTSVGSSKHADDRDNVWHSCIYNMPFMSWLDGTFDKSDPAATQGHLRSRHAQPAKIIGGYGLSVKAAQYRPADIASGHFNDRTPFRIDIHASVYGHTEVSHPQGTEIDVSSLWTAIVQADAAETRLSLIYDSASEPQGARVRAAHFTRCPPGRQDGCTLHVDFLR